MFEIVDDDGRRRTDHGPLVYYKLTLSAFGSGELKTYNGPWKPEAQNGTPPSFYACPGYQQL